jgi:hypothetical protein
MFLDSKPLLFFVFASAVVFGSFACSVAEAKGHDGTAWGFGGFFFGPIGFLASLGLPDLKTRKYLRLIAEKQGADLSDKPGQVKE